MASDLRFLFLQDCLGLRRLRAGCVSLCWSWRSVASRAPIQRVATVSRKAGCGCACVPGNSWQWRILELVFSGSRLLLPVIPRSRSHLRLCHDLPGRNRPVIRISQPCGTRIWEDVVKSGSAR